MAHLNTPLLIGVSFAGRVAGWRLSADWMKYRKIVVSWFDLVLRGMDTRLFVLVYCHLYNNRISRYTTSRGGRTEEHVHYSCSCTVRHDECRHKTKHVSYYWRRRWWRSSVLPGSTTTPVPAHSRSCKYYQLQYVLSDSAGIKLQCNGPLCHQLDSLWDTTITAIHSTGYTHL